MRSHTVANLDYYVEQFAANVEARGGHVFFAADAAEARQYVASTWRARRRVGLIVKSKSMVTEEIGLNPALEAAGVEVVETDLGEFIIQLARRAAVPHRRAGHPQVARRRSASCSRRPRDEELPMRIRRRSREYARRDAARQVPHAPTWASRGCNFGVAATGTVVLVTNEGNGRMTTTLPRTHVVVMGMERLVPDLGSLEPILDRAAVAGRGRAHHLRTSTAITGPRRAGDATAPTSCTS